jgi:c-di-GMP-binding flagellar brake protein YcgR
MSEYKRDHPRIKKTLPVEIIAPGDRTLFATTYDVSKRGVQLLCDGITVREIFGSPGLSRPTKPPSVFLKLRLSQSGQEPEQIEAECRAVFSRRVSEQEYRVGLQIYSLSEPSRVALDNFVDECLELS